MMGSVPYVEEERKALWKDVNWIACLQVRVMRISDGGLMVYIGEESSLVVEVKENQNSDPILLGINNAFH